MPLLIARVGGSLPESIWDHLARALPRSRGRIDLASLKQQLLDDRIQVWAVTEGCGLVGAVATEIVTFPTGRKVLRVFLAGGKGLSKVRDVMRQLEDFGRLYRCHSIEVEGRSGWGRVLRDFEECWTCFEKEL